MVDFINDNSLLSGTLMLLIGISWLVYQIKKKESFKMKDHGLGSWGVMVSTWGIIVFTILWGLILIIRNV